MRARVKAVFDQIEESARTMNYDEVRDLWALLTALRGPDNGTYHLKKFTTAVVRRETVPALSDRVYCDVAKPGVAFVAEPSEETFGLVQPHFADHMRMAGYALVAPE